MRLCRVSPGTTGGAKQRGIMAAIRIYIIYLVFVNDTAATTPLTGLMRLSQDGRLNALFCSVYGVGPTPSAYFATLHIVNVVALHGTRIVH